jgi:transposase
MTQQTLFPTPSPAEEPAEAKPRLKGKPRVLEADRHQVFLRPSDLDSLVAEDHRVRGIWEFVVGLDLSDLYARIDAVEGGAGRPATDPRILMALWLYATVEGVGSARALDRLCEQHVAYQWICGGVSVNYHTLADFRVQHVELLDKLLTESVAALSFKGLVEISRVAQDGIRVRASAGAASFRRAPTLQECLQEAEQQVQLLRQELEQDPAACSRRQQAARERARTERQQRVAEALRQLPEIEAKKKDDEKQKARASTTDPDARVMKMADGGFRPALNIQFSTDTKAQVIVGVDISNSGSDQGQMPPMVEQVTERYGEAPKEVLVDGGFAKKEDIDRVSREPLGCTVYAPVQKPKDPARDPFAPYPGDTETVAAWRTRMGTDEAKEIYKERAQTAECVNAIARNRGLQRFLVRGIKKAKAIALWFALAHNMMRGPSLQAAATAVG